MISSKFRIFISLLLVCSFIANAYAGTRSATKTIAPAKTGSKEMVKKETTSLKVEPASSIKGNKDISIGQSIESSRLDVVIKKIQKDSEFRKLVKSAAKRQGNLELFENAFESAECVNSDNEHCRAKQRNCAWQVLMAGGWGLASALCVLVEPCGLAGGIGVALGTLGQLKNTYDACKDMVDYCDNQHLDTNRNGLIEESTTVTILDDDSDGPVVEEGETNCNDPLVNCVNS